LWRLRYNSGWFDILTADETLPIEALLTVTTGLDPVVHADSHHTRRRPMDCRIKSGNDGEIRVTFPLTFVSRLVTSKYLAHLRDVFSMHT
jgi:hypothetical protein